MDTEDKKAIYEHAALTSKQRVQEDSYSFPYHYLDLKVDEYRYIYHVEYLHLLHTVKELLSPSDGKLILDFGCGDGRFAFEMRNEGGKMIGVDYSERAISFAKVFNPHAEFYAKDIKSLSLRVKFDHIVMIDTLEHIKPVEIPELLKTLAGMVKPEGSLIITVPSIRMPLIDKHYQHFTEATLKEAIGSHFIIKTCMGHSRIAFSRKVHSLLKRFGSCIFPFRKQIKVIYRYFDTLNEFWRSHYGISNPSECLRMIAVCSLKADNQNKQPGNMVS